MISNFVENNIFFSLSGSKMDLVLNVADYYFFTPYVYPSSWPEDDALRQIIGLMVATNLGAAILYLGLGALSYIFIFDHKLMQHPQFLEVCSSIQSPSVSYSPRLG